MRRKSDEPSIHCSKRSPHQGTASVRRTPGNSDWRSGSWIPACAELVAGLALGLFGRRYSDLFPVLARLPEDEVFRSITDLSIFFLMLLAGIELHPRELAGASTKAVSVALGGMVLPLAVGFAIGWQSPVS